MRSTFLYIGERCNVAGSSIYKKAIVDGDYDKAHAIGLKQVWRRFLLLFRVESGAVYVYPRCGFQALNGRRRHQLKRP